MYMYGYFMVNQAMYNLHKIILIQYVVFYLIFNHIYGINIFVTILSVNTEDAHTRVYIITASKDYGLQDYIYNIL